MESEELHYRLVELIQENPEITQRDLARSLGVSLGRTNYCLRALVSKGWVKIGTFRRSTNRRAYLYLLTPRGVEAKARLTKKFLKIKLSEYESLREEIRRLRLAAKQEGASDGQP